jgi:VanZ family protein
MKRKAMDLPRPLLHRLRIADEILFYPALLCVIWGELGAGPEPPLFDWLGDFKDKALHFIAYFGLAAMAAAGFKHRGPAGYAALGLILLGGVLEVIQGYTGRDMSAYDEIANTVGVLSGALVARTFIERLRKRLGYW